VPFRPVSDSAALLPGGFTYMGLLSLVVLALSMSADAFAAALSKGSVLNRPHFTEALCIGLLFGTVEAITPVIGWAAGVSAQAYVASLDHWTAFFVLGAVGGKMIWESTKRAEEEARPARDSFAVLLVTAIGTSIDSMAVGVTLAFINANIIVTAAAIGLATFMMATIGIMIGRVAGAAFGRAAEGLGGICLILIGAKILIQHTMFA
jgi:manganese efflux pump family protein